MSNDIEQHVFFLLWFICIVFLWRLRFWHCFVVFIDQSMGFLIFWNWWLEGAIFLQFSCTWYIRCKKSRRFTISTRVISIILSPVWRRRIIFDILKSNLCIIYLFWRNWVLSHENLLDSWPNTITGNESGTNVMEDHPEIRNDKYHPILYLLNL